MPKDTKYDSIDGHDLKVTTTRVSDTDFQLRVGNNNGTDYSDPDIMRIITDVDIYHRNLLEESKDREMASRVRIETIVVRP